MRSETDEDADRAMSRPGDDAVGSGSCSMRCSSGDDSRRTPRPDMAGTGSRPADLAVRSGIVRRSGC